MHNPTATILIICYNHQDYVAQSINSVLNQTYAPIELIVIDDYSTDNSVSVIEKLKTEQEFTFIKNAENRGLNNSIIAGLTLAKGDYISLLASDDFIVPGKIEEQLNYLVQSGDDGVYATGYTLQNDKQNLIKLHKVFDNYRQDKVLEHVYQTDWGAPLLQSALFKKEVWLSLAGLRKEYKSDDWAFLIKCLEQFKIGFIYKPYFFYRLHDNNTYKMYWKTFPMRMDIAAGLVPVKYRTKTISNIFISQSQYLIADGRILTGIKFFFSSLILNFSISNILRFGRSFGSYIKKSIRK